VTPSSEPSIPPVPLILGCAACLVVAVVYARWSTLRDLRRHRRPPGDPMPDRVWSGGGQGPWLVTLGGRLYDVLPGDLPRGRSLRKGFVSDDDLRLLAASRVTDDRPAQRLLRFERGDLTAAKLVHNTANPEAVPWRVDAIDRDGGYRLFGFESESDAQGFLGMLRANLLPHDDDPGAGHEEDIDAARARDEAEDAKRR
jgi:hypothetical protein